MNKPDSIQWLPWSPEAFALAQAEHKPMRILISSPACRPHSTGTTSARLTERYFIPVQVDGDALPHVAALYRRAAHILTGPQSLPLEIFADEQGHPFFAAGQLREVELAGLLSGIALHRSSDPEAYAHTASAVLQQLADTPAPVGESPDDRFDRLQSQYDEANGGFGKGAKHLRPHDLLFLLHHAQYTGEPLPRQIAEHTLYNMALGGIRDHIGGGFFHSTEDPRWEHPVPEKRLTDQAWMLAVYTRAWQMTGTELFRRVATETADFIIRELRHSAGGFFTAQWSHDGSWLLDAQFVYAALGQNDGSVFCREYSIGETPSVPHLFNGDSPHEDSVLLHDLRMKLYRSRLQRAVPQRDDKVQTGENGVTIAALARAGRVLGVERYITAAANGEAFLRRRLVSPTDLRRYYCHGAAVGDGVMGDFAGYAMGLLELYRCGCGTEYLTHAARVMARADALFSDRDKGGWYVCRGDGCLPLRPLWQQSEDAPSDRSVALWVMSELAKEIPHPSIKKRTLELMKPHLQ